MGNEALKRPEELKPMLDKTRLDKTTRARLETEMTKNPDARAHIQKILQYAYPKLNAEISSLEYKTGEVSRMLRDLSQQYEENDTISKKRFGNLSLAPEEIQARNRIYNTIHSIQEKTYGGNSIFGRLSRDEEKYQKATELLVLMEEKNLTADQKTQITNFLGNDKKDLVDKAFLDDVGRAEKILEEKKLEEAAAVQDLANAAQKAERAKRATERRADALDIEKEGAKEKAAEAARQKAQETKALQETKAFATNNKEAISEVVTKLGDESKLKTLVTPLQSPNAIANVDSIKKLQKALGVKEDGSFGRNTLAALSTQTNNSTDLSSLENKLNTQVA